MAFVMGKRIIGLGGFVGVAEPKAHAVDEDVFTDEEPLKADILQHKAKTLPLLMDAWGEYADFKLVGNGLPTNDKCGTFSGFKATAFKVSLRFSFVLLRRKKLSRN